MSPEMLRMLRHPFGEESCEAEMEALQESYPDYYFDEAPFNRAALYRDTYLLVGRRGTGKTSLSQYFKFQTQLNDARCIDVDEPQEYEWVLSDVATHASSVPGAAQLRIVKIWRYVLWSLIFEELRSEDSSIAAACVLARKRSSATRTMLDILKHLLNRFLIDKDIVEELEDYVASSVFKKAREAVLRLTQRRPIILAIDTLEQYRLDNEPLMWSIAGLVQCASEFNVTHAPDGIHVKAFVSAEIFPHIEEEVIPNSAKFIRSPLYLRWRPKDLMRLVCWRFTRYLLATGLRGTLQNIRWTNAQEVLEKVWYRYFGKRCENSFGRIEPSFPFILRYTQMRPRQVVMLCNEIARRAEQDGTFPDLSQSDVAEAVSSGSRRLAVEVLNAYSQIYPNASLIVDALRALPTCFGGNQLDKVARRTKAEWLGNYSTGAFRRLVAELGIVGRVRYRDEQTGIIEASFEHTLEGRLVLRDSDECVIHPMFYRYLETETDPSLIVYPFPDHEQMIGRSTGRRRTQRVA